MTDITELALRLKLEVHRAVSNFNPQMNIKTRDLKELVEALEKAQQRIGKLEKKLTDHKRMNQEMAKAMLTPNDSDAAGMEIAALRQRIAELESSGIASGILRCTECSFVQTKNIISISPDAIVIGNSKPEPCPNGCGSLQPVTWKALAIQLMFTTKQGVSELLEAKKRISELESFRTAYMEWGDKTDWVQGDKRFDVLIPWGKHRADVLKAYIERLESRTVTVKLPDYRNTYKSPFADEVEHQVRLALELFSSAAGIKVEAE
ncbi:TPA: hypothetical protein L9K96_000046 [Klebsiella quasipneumoniae subsp. quasipneumoniae]|nr:hypothetical protein [Klebsiella quasipneumoniae subsp. quasipneumoniae]